jgi:hypothetical protein
MYKDLLCRIGIMLVPPRLPCKSDVISPVMYCLLTCKVLFYLLCNSVLFVVLFSVFLFMLIVLITVHCTCYFVHCSCLLFYYCATLTEVFRAFSSVVRQMPGYNSQRRGTARIPNFSFLCIMCIVCV